MIATVKFIELILKRVREAFNQTSKEKNEENASTLEREKSGLRDYDLRANGDSGLRD